VGLPGTAVAAAFAGAEVAAGALAAGALAAGALAAGADVGAGTEVAEDPQANSRATNSRTLALGRYLLICNPRSAIGIPDSPLIHSVVVISAILSEIYCN